MALVQTPTPMRAPDTHAGVVWRKIWAVILGAGSVGLSALIAAAIYNVDKTYGSMFANSWPILWVLSLGIAYLMGAMAVALWSRPGAEHLGRRSGMVMAATFVVVFITMWFVGPLY